MDDVRDIDSFRSALADIEKRRQNGDFENMSSLMRAVLQFLLEDEEPTRGSEPSRMRYRYSKRDLAFALDVEPLTLTRWLSGNGIHSGNFERLLAVFGDIANGKPQRPTNVSGTGFFTAKYLFENKYPYANRTWHFTSSHILSARSIYTHRALQKLFEHQRAKPLVAVYLYTPGSEADANIGEFKKLVQPKQETLYGSVIGIEVNQKDLPWFTPHIRISILETDNEQSAQPELEGYIRIRHQNDARENISAAMGVQPGEPVTPWLRVSTDIVVSWYIALQSYCTLVDKAVASQNRDYRQSFMVQQFVWSTKNNEWEPKFWKSMDHDPNHYTI